MIFFREISKKMIMNDNKIVKIENNYNHNIEMFTLLEF